MVRPAPTVRARRGACVGQDAALAGAALDAARPREVAGIQTGDRAHEASGQALEEGSAVMKTFGRHNLSWRGDALYCGGKVVIHIVHDERYPSMRRVRGRDGRLSDMVNRARAKDAAMTWALADLNREETAAPAPPIAPDDGAATPARETQNG